MVTPPLDIERVGRLLRSRRVAIVGASDRSGWSRGMHRNLRASPGVERVVLVNPNNAEVHGEATVPSILDVDGEIDLGVVVLRAELVPNALNELAARGVRNAVVLASEFDEAGPDGQRRGEELRRIARDEQMAIIGPNTSGLVNVLDGLWAFGSSLSPPFVSGPIGIAAQSGGMASHLLRVGAARGVGIGAVVGVGNEAVISSVDVLRCYIADDRYRVVGAFLEGIRDPVAFAQMAEEALDSGKPVVVLKVGRHSAGRRAAASHTGVLVGDDRVISAAFRRLGVVRVDSIDELIATCGMLAYGPRLVGRRVGIVGSSGGACGMMGDLAEECGLEVPEFASTTVDAVTTILGGVGSASNPLDSTGQVMTDKTIPARLTLAVATDPGVDLAMVNVPLPERFAEADRPGVVEALRAFRSAADQALVPVVIESDLTIDLSPELADAAREAEVYLARGLELTFRSVSSSLHWYESLDRRRQSGGVVSDGGLPALAGTPDALGTAASGPLDEATSLALLVSAGAPVVDHRVVHSADEAAAAAAELGVPVAVKALAAPLTHKSDAGAVRLGVSGELAVRQAFEQVVTAASAAVGSEAVAGALVSAMRPGGIELFVSVARAGQWGTMLSLGLGGIWVEVLDDMASCLLPTTDEEIQAMLVGLQGAALLRGGRGRPPADLGRVAAAVRSIVDAAALAGPRLDVLEVNPLWVSGAEVAALDALAVLD